MHRLSTISLRKAPWLVAICSLFMLMTLGRALGAAAAPKVSLSAENPTELRAAEADAPLSVRAVVSHTTTLTPIKDTDLWENKPDNGYGSCNWMAVNRENNDWENALMQFDVSALPSACLIDNATLRLTVESGSALGRVIDADIHRVNRDWGEDAACDAPATNGATWNLSQNGVPWTTAGGDFDLTVIDSTAVSDEAAQGTVYTWDITPLVQDWYRGAQDNYGLALSSTTPTQGNQWLSFYTREEAVVANRPQLEIAYRCGGGAIAGVVWHDEDADGLRSGESGLAGIDVTLHAGLCGEEDPTPVRTTTTDADGGYEFIVVDAGDYCVAVDLNDLPADIINTTAGNALSVTVADAQLSAAQDFGYVSSVVDNRLSVGLNVCNDASWLVNKVASYGGRIIDGQFDACLFIVEVPPEQQVALQIDLQDDPDTAFADQDVRTRGGFVPNDPDYTNPNLVYAPQQINAEAAWDHSLGDPNLIIAVLDSGIDSGHQEFMGRLLPGYDYANEDNDPRDDHGHGTHVAGIAAAGINDNIGMAGMAGGAKILPMKVLNANNLGFWSDISQAIMDAVDQGANVINLSITGNAGSTALQQAIQYANQHGVLVVAAAGNDGTDTPKYPASYVEPNLISVGATTYDGVRWSLSNHGPNVAIVAPGQFVHSTHWQSGVSNAYTFMTGTSMAAPHVAGAAALLMSIDPALTPQQVIQYLTTSATDMGDSGFDSLHGHGRVDAGAAAQAVAAAAPPPPMLTLTKAVDKDVTVPGASLSYTVTLGYNGDALAQGVSIIDNLSSSTSYVANSANAGGTENNGIVTWAIGSNTAPVPGRNLLVLTGDLQTAVSTINQSSDDAEEMGPGALHRGGEGNVYISSTDLELIADIEPLTSGEQTVGMRFTNIDIPQGAAITNAYISLWAVDPDSPNTDDDPANLLIRGHNADNSPTFVDDGASGVSFSISDPSIRPRTSASVSWSPPAWSKNNSYTTPDLKLIVHELVNRPGWAAGNAMAFIVTGAGSRSAASWDGDSANAPRLTIEYTPRTTISLDSAMTAAPTLITGGDLITVTLTLTASQRVTEVTPSTPVMVASNGIEAVLRNGPTPANGTVGTGGQTFTWVYATTHKGEIGQLTFSGSAQSALGSTWNMAHSNSVIVVPPLTVRSKVNNPAGVESIANIARLIATGDAFDITASNTVVTAINSSIGDTIWTDSDGDGIKDPSENGISGVTVQLTDVLSRTATTVTDANGNYEFGGLEAGSYTISLDTTTLPPEYTLFTTPHPRPVTLGQGDDVNSADVGLQRLATGIGDFIWYDADGDGQQDVGEPGLGNVTVQLFLDDDGNGEFDPARDFPVDASVSNANGGYVLQAPIEGDYFIVISDDNGLLNGLQHTIGPNSISTPLPALSLTASAVRSDADYGYLHVPAGGNGVVMGQLWLDGDANLIRTPDEPILIGETVCATPVSGGPSICDETDINGRYLLELPAGDYDVATNGVQAARSATPMSLTPTTPTPLQVTVVAGAQNIDIDFGYDAAANTGALGGEIWQDIPVNHVVDGVYDKGSEPGIGNVSVNVIQDLNLNGDRDSGEPILATVSDTDGLYRFQNLLADDYLVEVTDTMLVLRTFVETITGPSPHNDDNNHSQPYAVHINPDDDIQSIDFGYREFEVSGAGETPDPGVIGNQVWIDMDDDGVFDRTAGDKPVAGVTVDLLQNGQVMRTATTGGDGTYLFTDLAFGGYTVEVSDNFGVLAGHGLGQLGSNPTADHHSKAQPYGVTISFIQTTDNRADFAYLPGATRGDCNLDGNVDAGDISALTLEIFDGDTDVPASAPGGTFNGSPSGCNANGDTVINAGDISCTVLLIFNGPNACETVNNAAVITAAAAVTPAQPHAPLLAIPIQILAEAESMVEVPIGYVSSGAAINSVAFSIDFDQEWLDFDPTDNNGDGIPDAVSFDLALGFRPGFSYDPNDTDGELDFTIFSFAANAALPGGTPVRITFETGAPTDDAEANVIFSDEPSPSYGSGNGASVPGVSSDGSVLIAGTGEGPTNASGLDTNASALVYAQSEVAIHWRTLDESTMLAFHVLRKLDGDYVQITDAPIPAVVAGQPDGAAYDFIDGSITEGETYKYALDLIAADDEVSRVELGAVYTGQRLFLPLINH